MSEKGVVLSCPNCGQKPWRKEEHHTPISPGTCKVIWRGAQTNGGESDG